MGNFNNDDRDDLDPARGIFGWTFILLVVIFVVLISYFAGRVDLFSALFGI